MATRLLHTVAPSGGDFTKLSDAIAHLATSHANLVAADVYADIEISGSWSSADTTAVTISGITTDATRYINIYTTGDARPDGTANKSGAYKLSVTPSGNLYVLYDNAVSYVTIDGLVVEIAFPSSQRRQFSGGIQLRNANNSFVKNCVVFASNATNAESYSSNNYGIYLYGDGTASTQYAFNNVVYGFLFSGASASSWAGIMAECTDYRTLTSYLYGNTSYASYTGIKISKIGTNSPHTNYTKNNIGYNNTVDFANSGTLTQTASNNLSKDTTAIGTSSVTSATLTFSDVTNKNFALVSSDTAAINAGADLGSSYNTDIIGTSRPQGSAWDIGAFEYISSGGETPTGFMTCNTRFW